MYPQTAYESFPESLLGDNFEVHRFSNHTYVRTFVLPSEQRRKALWNRSVNQEKRAWEERLHQQKVGQAVEFFFRGVPQPWTCLT